MLNHLSSTIHAIEEKIESRMSNVVYYALISLIVGKQAIWQIINID